MADKEKGTNPLPESPLSPSSPGIFFDKKSHRGLVFPEKMINMIIAKMYSLRTGKNGYGQAVVRPHLNEGRVALRTGLHGNLLWP